MKREACLQDILHISQKPYLLSSPVKKPYLRPSAHERFFFCRSGETAAAAAGMKRSVLNGSERTDVCFTAAFFQTQHDSFSVRCGGRTAVGGGNGTRKNIPACAHERQNNRTFQASANVMDLDPQGFWEWEINNWDGGKAGTLQFIYLFIYLSIYLFISILAPTLTVLMHPGLI